MAPSPPANGRRRQANGHHVRLVGSPAADVHSEFTGGSQAAITDTYEPGSLMPMSSGKIPVVDDEPSIVDAVGTALRYEGFEVEEAASGRDALAAATRSEPDLIVLDWMLPDLDGLEVGRRLRERDFRSAILFLTARDAVENKVEALRAGGDDYVTKPFSLAELVARVHAVLRRTAPETPTDVLRYDDLVLDEGRHEVSRGAARI